MGISKRLLIALLLVSLVPLLAVSVTAYVLGRHSLTHQVQKQLESVASIQARRVERIYTQNLERVALLSSRTTLKQNLREFELAPSEALRDTMSAGLVEAVAAIPDFRDIYVLDPAGIVVAATNPGTLSQDRSKQPYFEKGLTGETADVFYVGADGNLMQYFSAPLVLDGELLGVILVESTAESIVSLVTDYTGLGRTGETVLGEKGEAGEAILIGPARFGADKPLSASVPGSLESVPVNVALSGRNELLTGTRDYRDVPVLAATRYVEGPGWGLVEKIDTSEAYAPVNALGAVLLSIILFSVACVVLISLWLSRSITAPIRGLTRVADSITAGDLTCTADDSRVDEIGTLGKAFNTMCENLLAAQAGLELKVEERTAELALANEELEGYAYTVSHDLRGPLASLVLAIDGIKDAASGPCCSREMKEAVLEPARLAEISLGKAFRLIEDLLALAQAGRVPLATDDIDVEQVVRRVLEERAGAISEKGAGIRVGEELGLVKAHPTHVYQLFSNLIGNALKHGKCESPEIEVSRLGEDAAGRHLYLVRDNGPGIPEGDLERVFQPFFKGKGGETGIGLATVERIVKVYGGEIRACNDNGACFEFSLGDLTPRD